MNKYFCMKLKYKYKRKKKESKEKEKKMITKINSIMLEVPSCDEHDFHRFKILDNDRILVSNKNTLFLYDMKTGELIKKKGLGRNLSGFWVLDGKTILISIFDTNNLGTELIRWNIEKDSLRTKQFEDWGDCITKLILTKKGNILLGLYKGTLIMLDRNLECLQIINSEQIRTIKFLGELKEDKFYVAYHLEHPNRTKTYLDVWDSKTNEKENLWSCDDVIHIKCHPLDEENLLLENMDQVTLKTTFSRWNVHSPRQITPLHEDFGNSFDDSEVNNGECLQVFRLKNGIFAYQMHVLPDHTWRSKLISYGPNDRLFFDTPVFDFCWSQLDSERENILILAKSGELSTFRIEEKTHRLVNLCCHEIANDTKNFGDMQSLKTKIPNELYAMCFDYRSSLIERNNVK